MAGVSRCDACRLEPICQYEENLTDIRNRYGKVFNVECMYFDLAVSHLDLKEEESKSVCERCGKPADKLVECETCHKKVCPDCAESESDLDVNTNKAVLKTVCKDCWEA